MNVLKALINRLTVLVVYVQEDHRHRISKWEISHKPGGFKVVSRTGLYSPEDKTGHKQKIPVIVCFTGHGILSKEENLNSELVDKITHNEEFIWSSEKGENAQVVNLSFTRKQRIGPVLRQLEEAGISVALIRLMPDGVNETEQWIVAHLPVWWKEICSRKQWLRPDSPLPGCLFARLKWPLLVGMLVVCLGNYFVYSGLQEKYAERQNDLKALQKANSGRLEIYRHTQRLLQEFDTDKNYLFCFLADRLAARLPAGIVWTSLKIHPLQKKAEPGKPLVAEEGKVVLMGESRHTDAIVRWAGQVEEYSFVRQLKLSRLEKKQDSDLFLFTLEIDL